MGFGPLRLLDTFPVHLAGSQRQLNAYIFVKAGGSSGGGGAGGGASSGGVASGKAAAAAAGAGAGAKRKHARAAPVAAVAAATGSDASSAWQLPLQQWLRVNGICAEATSDATSKRVRRQRRLS